MPIHARLEIDNEQFNVLRCDFGYHYEYHPDTLQPRSNGAFYPINVRVETGPSMFLTRWAIDGISNNRPAHPKDGRIIFLNRVRDSSSALKGIHFRNGFVIRYKEYFEAEGPTPMFMDLVIVAEYMAITDTDERTHIAAREWTPPFHQNL